MFFQPCSYPQLTRFWSIALTPPSQIQSKNLSTFTHAWLLKPKRMIYKQVHMYYLTISCWVLINVSIYMVLINVKKNLNVWFFCFRFCWTCSLDVYFVVQDTKKDHTICYEAIPHCYLLVFSKFCYKDTSFEIIHFTLSMVQLFVHGAKWSSK